MFGLRFGAGEAPEATSQAGQDIRLPQPDVDQHRDDQDEAGEDVDPMLRHDEGAAAGQDDIELQERADERDDSGARQRADHAAVAAEDRPAADDDGGDGVELAELPRGRVEAAEEGGVDDAGHGRAQGGEHQRDEAHAPGVDARIVRGAPVAAGGVDHLTERRVGEDDAEDDRDHDHPQRLDADRFAEGAQRAAADVDAEMIQDVSDLAAQQVEALREAGQLLAGDDPGRQPARDIEHAEGRDEGRQVESDGDEGIDQSRRHARQQPHQHRNPGVVTHDLHGKGRRGTGQRQDSADREVDVAAGNDVGQADRQQRNLGVVQQDGKAVLQVPPVVGPQPHADQPQHHGQDDGERIAPRQEFAEAARRQRFVARHRALGMHAFDRNAGRLDDQWRLLLAQPCEEPPDQSPAQDIGLDQDRQQQQRAEQGRDGPDRQLGDGGDFDVLAVDLHDAGGRPALAQHLVDHHGQHGAEARADHSAAAAQDRRAADDDGGDHEQYGGEAGLRRDALVPGDCHQYHIGGAERRQQVGADAQPAGRDAGIDRGLLVAAGGESLVAPASLGEHERADDDDHQRDRDLVVEAESVGLAQIKELRILARLHRIADG